MRLLLISNSTNPGEAYLDYPKYNIKEFLGEKPVKALFIPYAAITFSYDEYEEKVNNRFKEIGHSVISIHHFEDPKKAVEEAEAIVVGGGNTWKLVRMMRDNNIIDLIRKRVQQDIPYIGWSAGSNVACPTLRTTNDMPIIDPKGFDVINLVPFQINPHYLDAHPEGHGGETREDRIKEFITENPDMYVVGLREGTMLNLEDEVLKFIGKKTARIFKYGEGTKELEAKDDFSFLLKNN
ncbi:MAG: dipeptidase PepE [Prevotella sp.]|jgi:dipeptidase E|nr:dipeptidase PepE [Prevotella sp.]